MEEKLWKDEYSVGVEKLDLQHQQILEMVEKLSHHTGISTDTALIHDTLNAMLQYSRQHFTTEEELMEEYKYPETEQQKRQHAYFLKKMAELSIHAMEAEEIAVAEMTEFLKNWWLFHILKWDMKYKKFFRVKQAQTSHFGRSIESL